MSYIFTSGSYSPPLIDNSASCSVVAIRNAFDVSEEEALALCLKYGYKPKLGMDFRKFGYMLEKCFPVSLIGVFGCTLTARYLWTAANKDKCFKGMSLGRFLKTHPTGTYVLAVTGHFTVVKDGKLKDHGAIKAGTSVIAVWKIQDVDTL